MATDRVSPRPSRATAPELDTLWLRAVTRPALITVLITCLAAGPLIIGHELLRSIRGSVPDLAIGLAVCAAFALIGCYTTTWLADPSRRDRRTAGFRAAELLSLLLFVRVIIWGLGINPPTLENVYYWIYSPLSFFDGVFFVWAIVGLLAWDRANAICGDFIQMALQSDELRERSTSGRAAAWEMDARAAPVARTLLLERFIGRWMWGGVLLVFMAGLSRVDLDQPGWWAGILGLGLPRVMIVALLGYFLCGLILIAHGQLAVLRGRWSQEGSRADTRVVRHWNRYALVLILGAAFLAGLLPFGDSFWLAVILATIIDGMMQVLYALFLGFLGLLSLIMSLFGNGESDPNATAQSPPPELEFDPLPAAGELPPWLGGGIFWILMLGILVMALVTYLRGRGVPISLAWLTWLLDWLRRGGEGVEQWWQSARRSMRNLRPEFSTAEGRWRWPSLRPRQLDPRQRVRYFYISTVQRAGKRGLPRRPGQTPSEYAQELERSLPPEVEVDVEVLTDAFVQARYTQRPIDEDQASSTRTVWQRVKAALRRLNPRQQG